MNIIPLPAKFESLVGIFLLTPATVILTDPANQKNAASLQRLLTLPTGYPIQIRGDEHKGKNAILLQLDQGLGSLGEEGYQLEVLPDSVVVRAFRTPGIFYGIQTLRQLLPIEIEDRTPVPGVKWFIPCLRIEDKPRFPWRGFMLDEGRHFHGKETVLLTLDLMALQKLNKLHWHLTEDQGWRIEIKKYPKLTEVGSYRVGTSQSFGNSHNGEPHGGFYTQDEIREIITYASERHITVVPEIEMPGHSLAALASYPELSCTGGPFKVATHFGIFSDIYCAGKDATFDFLEDVLDEILDLFPSPVIHIGGDEAPKARWKTCPYCQKRIRKEGLKDEHALQTYFTDRIARHLSSKGRRVMGWNEILNNHLVGGSVVQFWAGNRKHLVNVILTKNQPVVMSTYLDAYLDHSYSLMPLSRAYHYEPVPAELNEDRYNCILGLEFPLWSEWVPDRPRLDYQVYPRLTAMAETGWTPKEKKSFPNFVSRLNKFQDRLTRLGVGFAPLNEAEPWKIIQWFGIFTIPLPQRRTAKKL